MEPHRHDERAPTRLSWHDRHDQEPSSRSAHAYARTSMAEQYAANPYDGGYRVPSEPLQEAERDRFRRRRGAIGGICLDSSGMPFTPPPPFPPPGFPSGSPAAVMEAQRNRVRAKRRAAIGSGSSGSLVMPPPPLPSYTSPGATVNPAAVSGAAEPSTSGRNRTRSPSHPWGPPPPPRSPEFPSFDEAFFRGTANLNNDEYRTRPATFQEAMERNRARNSEPFPRGSGSRRSARSPGPSSALPSLFPLSNERPSRGTTDPTHGSFSAALQEAVDYNRGLAAQDTGSRPSHPPPPASEQAPALSARERQLEAMNLAAQPRNRALTPSEHARLLSAERRINEIGARVGVTPRPHQDAIAAHPNHEADTMTRSNTRRRTIPTISHDLDPTPSAEQGPSYLQLLNEKIESFVQALPIHVLLDLPADSQYCAICLEKYYGPHQQECPIRLPCNHVFGKDCMLTWLKSPAMNRKNNACPVCRAVLLERVPIFPPMDDFPDVTFSEHDISDHHEEGFTDRLTDEEAESLWDLEREALAAEINLERTEHQNRFRESEEYHQRELARIRREHAERVEMVRGERRRRRTEG